MDYIEHKLSEDILLHLSLLEFDSVDNNKLQFKQRVSTGFKEDTKRIISYEIERIRSNTPEINCSSCALNRINCKVDDMFICEIVGCINLRDDAFVINNIFKINKSNGYSEWY